MKTHDSFKDLAMLGVGLVGIAVVAALDWVTRRPPHVLGEEECLVAHLDGDPRSCRRCLHCRAWLRPSQWDAACPDRPH